MLAGAAGGIVQLFLDSANLDHIREVHGWGVLAGVTTNPSLVAKEGRDFVEMVHEICELVQGPVSAEVVAPDVEGMVREGRLLAKVHDCVVVKVPMSEAGLGACRQLADEGIRVNVTLCFQASQALLAGLAGAAYISPFVGRVDDVSWDGNDLVRQIVEIYAQSETIHTQVLAASLRHPMHLVHAALAGAHVGTAPYSVLKAAVKHPLTDIGNEKFLADWEKVPDRDIAGQVERWLNRRGSVS
jgi:transaldolase